MAYRELCATLCERVRVELPRESWDGLAEAVDYDGATVAPEFGKEVERIGHR